MSCTRRFLNFEWEHHRWHKAVTSTDQIARRETDMWGRRETGTYVRCHKLDVCEVCGKTRGEFDCVCDNEVGDHCAIRVKYMEHELPPSR